MPDRDDQTPGSSVAPLLLSDPTRCRSDRSRRRASPDPATDEATSDEISESGAASLSVTVGGVVLHDWEPVAKSNVWVALIDTTGNSYWVARAETDNNGEFSVKGPKQVAESAPLHVNLL